jgi:hypothetical protein
MLLTVLLSDRSPQDHGDDAVARCSCEACERAARIAGRIQRGLRDVQAQEIEVGETAAAYLAYGVLRRGWGQ